MMQNVVDLLIRHKISCKAKSSLKCVCQNTVDMLICWSVDLLIRQIILARPPCSLSIWCKMLLICWFAKKFLISPNFLTMCVSKRCWSVDSPKNPCETSLLSIHMVQNVVDLLIRQNISCKAKFFNSVCVKTLLICWLAN